jgi:sugar lactone lactonase YvrE
MRRKGLVFIVGLRLNPYTPEARKDLGSFYQKILLICWFVLSLSQVEYAQAQYNYESFLIPSPDYQLDIVEGLAVEPQGGFYVSSSFYILKFDSNGNFLSKFGSSGTGNGQFKRYAGDLELDGSGNIYVADTENHRIQKFSNDGTFLMAFGANGSGDGQFAYPMDVTIDDAGNIYVVDAHNHRIQKFDANGNFLAKFGGLGTINGRFNNPRGICIFNNTLYVTDNYNNRVQYFDLSGVYINNFWVSSPNRVSVSNTDGTICVTTDYPTGNLIKKFSPTGVLQTSFGAYGTNDGQFTLSKSIGIDTLGNIYAVDYKDFSSSIQKFSSSDVFIYKLAENFTNAQFDNPAGICKDKFGNFWLTDTELHKVKKFDSQGNFVLQFGTLGSADNQFNKPIAIDADANGNIFVVDGANHRIQKFDNQGNFISKFGANGSSDGQFNYPVELTIDQSGNIYVADGSNNRIQKFDNSGVFISKFGTYGSGNNQFAGLTDIEITKDDLLVIAERN